MKLFLFTTLFLLSLALYSQNGGVSTIDSLDKKYLNWYNLSPASDKDQGASVTQSYSELLKNKTPGKKIVVAVIDGGVDIAHPELQGKIWINSDEISGNGIDDDKNGFVDDINGWNFIGNSKGENILFENMEYVRIFRTLNPKFEKTMSISDVKAPDQESYKLYLNCKTKLLGELEKYTTRKKNLDDFEIRLNENEALLKEFLKKDDLTLQDIESVKSGSAQVMQSKDFLLDLYNKGFTHESLTSMKDRANNFLEYYLNLKFDARKLVADNPDDITDTKYGNSDVKGPRSFHGTFVAGIIAAKRNNGIGIDGIADNVEIMVLRVVPDGDERDKDVALAIRYAADNGANIINMSFGKNYTTGKQFVDDAVKYAEEHNVLMVHAAGNDAVNVDLGVHFPSNTLNDGTIVKNWLTIGATTDVLDKNFCAVFSNYGQKSVDLFAPGVNIISLYPDNAYNQGDGTSYSCPVVSGVAALVWSYYPELTSLELKEVLTNSTIKYPKKKVSYPNVTSDKKSKVKFSKLSVTGGIISAYDALVLAEKMAGNKSAKK